MLVLATDMARHSEIMETFKSKVENFDYTSEDDINSVWFPFILTRFGNCPDGPFLSSPNLHISVAS